SRWRWVWAAMGDWLGVVTPNSHGSLPTQWPETRSVAMGFRVVSVSQVVALHAGVVDKFIGDGLMAVFLPSTLKDNHALRAVRAGMQMQKELTRIKEDWQSRRPEVKDIGIRIGINSGEMVAGNIGSQSRMEYTVIGDNVNVASRIESNGQVGEVLVGEATYQRVRSQGVRAERLEPLSVKNREQPVDVYRIMI
ncbi:MAG: adenylate/guanylate cyclase domain-containing protein, partial [Cyanobium sp.]